jgi:hypothetical protein
MPENCNFARKEIMDIVNMGQANLGIKEEINRTLKFIRKIIWLFILETYVNAKYVINTNP